MEICANSKESGYRKSGREIYSLLHKSKYTNIKFEKQGITTVGISMEEKNIIQVNWKWHKTSCSYDECNQWWRSC